MTKTFKTLLSIAAAALFFAGCGAPPPTEPPLNPPEEGTSEADPKETPDDRPPEPISPEATETGEGTPDSKMTEQDHFDIALTIRTRSRDLTDCYGKVLEKKAPPADGFLVETQFAIEADGSVAGVEFVSATERDADAEACFLRIIAGLQFGPPPEGRVIKVKYPFKIRRKK